MEIITAGFLLRHKTEEALSTLEKLSTIPGEIGSGARKAIQRWNDGNWPLDEV